MSRLRHLSSALRSRPQMADSLLAVAVFLGTAILPKLGPMSTESIQEKFVGGVIAAVVCTVLAFRRRVPILSLIVATGFPIAGMVVGRLTTEFIPAVLIATYTVASRTDRTTSLIAGVVTALTMNAAATLTSGQGWSSATNLILIVWAFAAAAAGEAVRSRRALLTAVAERERRAEQSREEEARRRVMEERLRISRELHDIIAHHIALINVQAGVASHLLTEQPDDAQDALAHIRQASRSVLQELSTMLGVLRQSGEQVAPTEPAPGLDRLDSLLWSLRTAGLNVDFEVSGVRRPLPVGTDLAAYRVVQEALTNAHKHGGGAPTKVEIVYNETNVMIEIRNKAPDPGGPTIVGIGTGHGILGMRERAAAVGGWLRAGTEPNGEFAVVACLPLPEGDGRDDSRAVG